MTQPKIQPVILCGGAGSRLWPLSRATAGKPFVEVLGDTSLFSATLRRIDDAALFEPPVVVCNESQRFLAAEQLRAEGVAAGALILEPEGRNTAPAVAVAALVAARRDPESLLLVLPSDHAISNRAGFQAAVSQAAAAASAGWLMTFGITPDRPETGYGYIETGEALPQPGAFRAARFVEKPDRRTAEGYLARGGYLWNSGMFLFPLPDLLEELARLAPEVLSGARQAVAGATLDLDFTRLPLDAYQDLPKISIDYALMEKTTRAGVVPVDLAWSDIGSWDSLWQLSELDEAGNARLGDVQAEGTSGSYLRSDKALLVALGLRDLVVVAQKDAVLVCPRDRAQELRDVVEQLAIEGRPEVEEPSRVLRPWGSFESLHVGAGFQAKHLVLKPGASISLQRHRHRSEHWVVVRGSAEVTRGEETFPLEPGQSTFIPAGTLHRLRNPAAEPLHIIEVQCGAYLGEDDIERFDDAYGRE